MATYSRHDVVFSHSGIGTSVCVCPTSDRLSVDACVSTLSEHQILGISVFASSPSRGYAPIACLVLSSGEETIIFALDTSASIPASLQLLLTHADYTKIAFGHEDVVTHLFIDFGVALTPLHDLADILRDETGHSSLRSLFRSEFPAARFQPDAGVRHTNWWSHQLTMEQISYAAFEAFFIRRTWLRIAQPHSYPPQALTQPIDVEGVCENIERSPTMREGIDADVSVAMHRMADSMHISTSFGGERYPASNGDVGVSRIGRSDHSDGRPTYMDSSRAPMHYRVQTHHSFHAVDPGADTSHRPGEYYGHASFSQQTSRSKNVAGPFICMQCDREFDTFKGLQQHRYARVKGICYPDGPSRQAVSLKDILDLSDDEVIEGGFAPGSRDIEEGEDDDAYGAPARDEIADLDVSAIPVEDDAENEGPTRRDENRQGEAEPDVGPRDDAETERQREAAEEAEAAMDGHGMNGEEVSNRRAAEADPEQSAAQRRDDQSHLHSRQAQDAAHFEEEYGRDRASARASSTRHVSFGEPSYVSFMRHHHHGEVSIANIDAPTHLDSPSNTALNDLEEQLSVLNASAYTPPRRGVVPTPYRSASASRAAARRSGGHDEGSFVFSPNTAAGAGGGRRAPPPNAHAPNTPARFTTRFDVSRSDASRAAGYSRERPPPSDPAAELSFSSPPRAQQTRSQLDASLLTSGEAAEQRQPMSSTPRRKPRTRVRFDHQETDSPGGPEPRSGHRSSTSGRRYVQPEPRWLSQNNGSFESRYRTTYTSPAQSHRHRNATSLEAYRGPSGRSSLNHSVADGTSLLDEETGHTIHHGIDLQATGLDISNINARLYSSQHRRRQSKPGFYRWQQPAYRAKEPVLATSAAKVGTIS